MSGVEGKQFQQDLSNGVDPQSFENNGYSETEMLGKLSVLITKGTTPTSYGHSYSEEGIPFLRVENISGRGRIDLTTALRISSKTHDFLCRSQLEAGDVLVTIAGTIGRTAVVGEDHVPANCNQAVAIIRLDRTKLVPEYLKFYIRSHGGQRSLLGDSVQLAQANLSLERLGELGILRLGIDEQSSISAVLDTLDSAIEKSEALIAKLKQVRAGMLHDLLMYGVDESSGADSDKSIPRYWPSVVLGKLAEITGGVTLGRSVDGQDAIELPYLRVANVQDGFIDTNDVKTVRIFRSELQRYALSSGDVLMNEGGDFDKLGRGAVWDGRISPCLHQNHVFRVRCGDRLLPVFLALYSASPAGKRYFVQASKQTTNLASINLTQLKAFPIKLPDIAEQSKIVKLMLEMDSSINTETSSLIKLESIKSGLMTDLLTGQTRIPPNLELP